MSSKSMSVYSMAIAILLVSFFVMVFFLFPIAYALALSSVFCLMSQGLPLTTICQQMVKGISSFSLMAVPFFIVMGCLMGTGGISEKLIALANACVGWMRGGMAMVNIVASYFFGGISGSASADTASLGSLLIPMMVDQGYDADPDHLFPGHQPVAAQSSGIRQARGPAAAGPFWLWRGRLFPWDRPRGPA